MNYEEDKLRKQAAVKLAGQGEQLIFKLSVKVKHVCVCSTAKTEKANEVYFLVA